MKRVQSVHRTETDGMIRVTVYERDADAPVGSTAAQATSRVVYEGKDQVAARSAEEQATDEMFAKRPEPVVIDEAAKVPPSAFKEFVRR